MIRTRDGSIDYQAAVLAVSSTHSGSTIYVRWESILENANIGQAKIQRIQQLYFK